MSFWKRQMIGYMALTFNYLEFDAIRYANIFFVHLSEYDNLLLMYYNTVKTLT